MAIWGEEPDEEGKNNTVTMTPNAVEEKPQQEFDDHRVNAYMNAGIRGNPNTEPGIGERVFGDTFGWKKEREENSEMFEAKKSAELAKRFLKTYHDLSTNEDTREVAVSYWNKYAPQYLGVEKKIVDARSDDKLATALTEDKDLIAFTKDGQMQIADGKGDAFRPITPEEKDKLKAKPKPPEEKTETVGNVTTRRTWDTEVKDRTGAYVDTVIGDTSGDLTAQTTTDSQGREVYLTKSGKPSNTVRPSAEKEDKSQVRADKQEDDFRSMLGKYQQQNSALANAYAGMDVYGNKLEKDAALKQQQLIETERDNTAAYLSETYPKQWETYSRRKPVTNATEQPSQGQQPFSPVGDQDYVKSPSGQGSQPAQGNQAAPAQTPKFQEGDEVKLPSGGYAVFKNGKWVKK